MTEHNPDQVQFNGAGVGTPESPSPTPSDLIAAERTSGTLPGEAHDGFPLDGIPVEGESAADDPAGPRIIQTDADNKDGLNKCARCGATDISQNAVTGLLRCNFCRFEWQAELAEVKFGLDTDIRDLAGVTIGSGAADIIPGTDEIVTFKCSACGAEVVIDTAHSTQARCHWCRNMLSMNEQMPNGAIPDMILPFKLTRDEAIANISKFVKRRKFFANPKFRREFQPENVVGVYLPYMVVDVNAHVRLAGQGEKELRRYTVGSGDNKRTVYDADVYDVAREFDLIVDDLTVESSAERLDQRSSHNTNNIINTIMPFDTKNAVKYDANYLSGFTSERRTTNIEHLEPLVRTQVQDIARHKGLTTIRFYDRGVRWDEEQLNIKGERWITAYLPVWLYSYQQKKSNGASMLHYVAVNARTGETMGSVPLNIPKLVCFSVIVEIFGGALFVLFS